MSKPDVMNVRAIITAAAALTLTAVFANADKLAPSVRHQIIDVLRHFSTGSSQSDEFTLLRAERLGFERPEFSFVVRYQRSVVVLRCRFQTIQNHHVIAVFQWHGLAAV